MDHSILPAGPLPSSPSATDPQIPGQMSGADPAATPATTTGPDLRRLGPIAGVAATLIALLVPSPESPASTTGPALRDWISEQAGTIRLFSAAMAVSAVLIVIFAADLRRRMRASAPESLLPDVAFGSALLCSTWLLVSSGFNSVLGYDTTGYTDEQLVTFYSLGQAGDLVGSASALAKGAFMLAVSAAALRAAFLPRWVAWLGVGFGAIALTNIISVVGVGAGGQVLFYAGLFAFALWPAFVGGALLSRERRDRRRAAQG